MQDGKNNMPQLNKKGFGASVTASIVRAGGKCWKRLGSAAPTTDYTNNNVVSTCEDDTECLGLECSNDNPSLIASITAPDGDLPITWLGYTWLPSTTPKTLQTHRYSGEDAEICPGYYLREQTFNDLAGDLRILIRKHLWGIGGGITQFGFNSGSLDLYRLVWTYWSESDGSWDFRYPRPSNYLILSHNSIKYKDRVKWTTTIHSAQPITTNGGPNDPLVNVTENQMYLSAPKNTVSNDLNMILGVPRPRHDNYWITDAFFGTKTLGNVTYTWSRGSNWP
jgi:hypothetical protein